MREIKKEKLLRGGLFILAVLLVYLGFRFVLPVVVPFVIGWFLAVRMKKVTVWLKKHLRIPEGLSASVLLAAEAGIAGVVLYLMGGMLIEQLSSISAHFPQILEDAEELVFSCCRQAEEALSLPDGILVSATEKARTFVDAQIEERDAKLQEKTNQLESQNLMLEKISRSLVEECRGQGKSRAEAERMLCDRMGMDPDLARKAVQKFWEKK